MNPTEQTAQPSSKMLDMLNVLQTAEKKAPRKAAKADRSSFGQILSEKSLTLQKKNGQCTSTAPSQKTPSAKGKTPQEQQATGASTNSGEKTAVQEGSSQSKQTLPDLTVEGDKTAATPITKKDVATKEMGTAASKKQDSTTGQADEDLKQSAQAVLCETDPMQVQGSDRGKQGQDLTAVIQTAVIEQADPFCQDKVVPDKPKQVLGENTPTASEGYGANASASPNNGTTGGADGKNLTMADPSESVPVKPSAGDPAVPKINPEFEKAAEKAARTATTKASVEETSLPATNRKNLDGAALTGENASGETTAETPSRRIESVDMAASEPNTALQATGERSVKEEIKISDKRMEAPRSDAPERSAVNVEADNGQDRVAPQMEKEIATKASQTNQEAASLLKPHRRTDRSVQDGAAFGLSSKEASQLAASEIKKSTTSMGDNGEMTRPVSSGDAEASSVRTAATTRIAPSKETVSLYAAAAESGKDQSKVMARSNHDDQTAETVQMKSFTLGSSQSAGMDGDSVVGPSEAKARALVDQIVEARQQMSSESGRIKITLTPPNLGTVDLDVVVRQNRVEVIMIADQADVQQLLQARGDEIKSALQRQDMKIDSFQVFLQNSPDGGQQQQSGSWTAMQDHSRRQFASYETQEGEGALPLPASEVTSTRLHKGMVSIFA